jgi:hypothetical protein
VGLVDGDIDEGGAVKQIAPRDGTEESQFAIAVRFVLAPICAGISIAGHLSRHSSSAASASS